MVLHYNEIDIAGQQFGYFTALYKDESKANKHNSYWFFQCKCGTVKSFMKSGIVNGYVKSCGCLHLEKDNIIGQRFGLLVAIQKVKSPEKNRRSSYWLFQCDCGSQKIIRKSTVIRGKLDHCGCKSTFKYLNNGKSASFNFLYKNYKSSAEKRYLDFSLSYAEFEALIYQNCYYCGIEPQNHFKHKNIDITYNGIDRIDNTKGYILGNVRTACANCNRAKRIL